MNKMPLLCLCSCLSLLFLTGCWDRKELNERAIWLASGWDVAENGEIEISGQIVIPANIQTQGGGGGAAGQGYFTISAKGKNAEEALQNIQTKLPREAFFGQRRLIFFSEAFARRGLEKELDLNNRSPDVSLRSDIFVVKGMKAKELLTVPNPLEKSPAASALKEHRQSGGRGDTAYLHLLIAANREGISPTIPAIEISSSLEGMKSGKDTSPNPKVFRLAGVSVFDQNLKMVGEFLNSAENRDMLWVMGILKKINISIQTKDSNASINFTKITSKIEPILSKNNKVNFTVKLIGEGILTENNSGLDVEYNNNLKLLEKEFEVAAQKQVQQTIKKVQKKYGLDIFGFGEAIHRKHPIRWKKMKGNWNQTFSQADISVQSDIKIKRIGMNGPSLLFKESEIKK
ncbi:Ger(x)C family spore germination protein [Neobacillus sp. OS1-2]|uniref:Ger(x)C family spore germination protein n=1 Tax=Neobacillus sp. OS1-2 TaxID=3070680 RepID=UPI0027DED600|nr:Ger(x)C family spore germination protein [Neobacillus sp. OS1-2]WML42105.1 Ger(x)C family spore germination protein [Neobacillus sp. OS1-2]